MNAKKYCIAFFTTLLIGLLSIIGVTYFVDPFFHYHAPNENLPNVLELQRYKNDGIIRHFNHNAIIIGTSMTENFHTSELDELFEVQSIKTPYAAASYKEIATELERALGYDTGIQMVVRALDFKYLDCNQDFVHFEPELNHTYLYDNNIFTDVHYVFNKSTLFEKVLPVLMNYGQAPNLNFDEYCNWNDDNVFGRDAVLEKYEHVEHPEAIEQGTMSDENRVAFQQNIDANVVATIAANPDIEFYYFIPPYSICFWDQEVYNGKLNYWRELETMLIESLLPYENCHLYSFYDDTTLITDLSKYMDTQHYSEDVNSMILENMKNGIGLLTEDNYQEYLERCYEFYANYDYNTI